VFTPNIDRLAADGVLFTNAHCVAPMCNPSRAALWTGKRPSTTGVYDQVAQWDDCRVPVYSLPAFFRDHGYRTMGCGKIYHHGAEVHPDPGFEELLPYELPTQHPEPPLDRRAGILRYGALPDSAAPLPSERWTDWACTRLGQVYDRPFLLTVGLFKPHTPLWIPSRFFDLYPLESIVVPDVPVDELDDIPEEGHRLCMLDQYFEPMLVSGNVRELIQAYLAAISYVDWLVGRLIAALESGPNLDSTVVVLWSDHGFHFGEKMHFAKCTLWEESTRVPLIVRAPGVSKPGGRCASPIDSVDLYPTVADLCGLTPPGDLDGVSFRALVADPHGVWERPALAFMHHGQVAVRSEHWRYIRYRDGTEELYDHRHDPHEHRNLADNTAFRAVRNSLAAWIPAEFALPALPYPAWEGWVHPLIREEYESTQEKRLRDWVPPEAFTRSRAEP
jgi:arylsulfatase A-like enzyme